MKKLVGLISIVVGVVPAFADNANSQLQVEVGAESSHLSNGSPDWRAQSLRLTRKQGPREVKEVTLTQTNRFGLDDQQISGLYSTPLLDKLTVSFVANISPSHRVLARQEVEGGLQYEFAPAWLLHGGLANKRYEKANVDQASLAIEHYFSAFSVSAAWRPVRALGVSSSSYQLRGSYYYGDANFVGVIAGSGREATSVSADSVLLADVRATALLGRHWLSRQWAVNYAITSSRQGRFYSRSSISFGAQYFF